jgi:hypothetical protein
MTAAVVLHALILQQLFLKAESLGAITYTGSIMGPEAIFRALSLPIVTSGKRETRSWSFRSVRQIDLWQQSAVNAPASERADGSDIEVGLQTSDDFQNKKQTEAPNETTGCPVFVRKRAIAPAKAEQCRR